MPWFKTQSEIELDMLSDLEGLTELKLSPDDVSREEVIKIKQDAIALSHAYAQIDRVADDFFPGSASKEGLIKHLAAKQMSDQEKAQSSIGTILHTGTAGKTLLAGNSIRRTADGKIFYLVADATLDITGEVEADYKSVLAGQDQNVDVVGDAFEMVSPQDGIDNACTNTTRFLDGRDIETPEEMLDRIVDHDQGLDTGGNLTAYERLAKDASDAVVTAHSIKNPRGADTVDTVITSGTTDIEAAVLAGDPVERVPSEDLVAEVQAYIIARNPTTDDHLTVGVVEDNFDTTLTFDLYDETERDDVEASLTQIWKIFVYSAVSGEDADPTVLERQIDAKIGHLIKRRRVSDFGDGVPQYTVPAGHVLLPHTLTFASFS